VYGRLHQATLCVGMCTADNVACNPRSDATAAHPWRRRSDALIQIQTLLQGRTWKIRLHRYQNHMRSFQLTGGSSTAILGEWGGRCLRRGRSP